MGKLAVVAWIALAVFASCAVQPAAADGFVIARAGASYPGGPGGYVEATLDDVRSASFAAGYNPFGLTVAGGGEGTVAVPHCAVVAVREGVLAFGPTDNVSLVGPFGIVSAQWESGSTLSGPVQFGAAGGGFVGAMSAAFQRGLYTVPVAQASRCYGKTAMWGVFRPARFYFGRTGPAYPSGPASDPSAVLATLADVTARDFVTGYNAAGVQGFQYASGQAGGCCAVRVAEGYLTYTDATSGVTSFVVPHYHNAAGTDACDGSGFARLSGNQRFATKWASDGSSGHFLPQLTYENIRSFNVSFNGPSQCNNNGANSFALMKSGPSDSPYQGNCWKITVQGDYYTPSTSSCLADRWHFDTRNGTVQDIQLNSFNTCGGDIVASGFSISNYNDKHALASVSGLTNCAGCTATDKLIPLPTGSEMSTVCYVTVGNYGWCRVLVQVEKNYECPTPMPMLKKP